MSDSERRGSIRKTRIEDYLYAVEQLTCDGGLATTGKVAALMGIANGTASSFLKQLADDGFVNRQSYTGVVLTGDGRLRLDRMRTRLERLESFLLKSLPISESQAKQEAWYWELVASDQLVKVIELS
jgi:DtxR family transcriptional regulator, Mn-dependent transcriptional regulator